MGSYGYGARARGWYGLVGPNDSRLAYASRAVAVTIHASGCGDRKDRATIEDRLFPG